MRSSMRLLTCLLALLGVALLLGAAPAASATAASSPTAPRAGTPPSSSAGTTPAIGASWSWPLAGARAVASPFRAPAHEYGAGHRGIDLVATPGATVSAPAAGVVAFRGTVVDRPLLTIEHGDGLVSTFEPVASDLLPGDAVTAGQPLGVVGVGGHTPTGAVHLGVRWHGTYINPMLLFGPVARAVLLPCCTDP